MKSLNTLSQFHDLKNKNIVITGGASGIGAGLVEGFYEQGARVIFLDRDEKSANALLKKINSKNVSFKKTDLSKVEQIKKSFAFILKKFQSIDVLINNAANDKRHSFLKASVKEWDWSLAINLRSYFFSMQSVLNQMIKKKTGNIINFSSNSFLLGLSDYPGYTASKAAIVSLTKSLAREVGKHNIRVNSILPGWVMTEKQKKTWATPAAIAECLKEQSLKELIKVEDIIGPTLFLASDSSKMITGETLIVDGGRV